MKRFLLTLLTLALVAGALYVSLKPVVIDQIRLQQGAEAVADYRNTASAMDIIDCGTRLAQAREYNEAMSAIALRDPFEGEEDREAEAVSDALDLNEDGVIAVLSIPKLGAAMPVYAGDDQTARENGASHLEGTSLPVGGAGTHCVLYARRDGRFSGLDRLIPGDCFYIETIQDTLVYEVEQVQTPEGTEVGRQAGWEDEDACTLVTMASRDEDSRRLMVQARRVSRWEAPLADDTQPLPDWAARGILALPLLLAGLIVLALVETLRRAVRRGSIKRARL